MTADDRGFLRLNLDTNNLSVQATFEDGDDELKVTCDDGDDDDDDGVGDDDDDGDDGDGGDDGSEGGGQRRQMVELKLGVKEFEQALLSWQALEPEHLMFHFFRLTKGET
jgi:hypothetical protein